jgi:hypothetical protein
VDDADFAKLGKLAKSKSILHGRKTAYTPKAWKATGETREKRFGTPEEGFDVGAVYLT